MADRFFCAEIPPGGGITLRGDEAKHLARVARRAIGDHVEVFDGRGNCVEAEILEIERDHVRLQARSPVPDRETSVSLSLLVAVPKGERFDWIVEKATEVGVARLIPLKAARSVVDPRSAKMERLRRVILEASKQCGRNRLMVLEEPIPSLEAFERDHSDVRLLAEAGGAGPVSWPRWRSGGSVSLAVGPEGGWTEAELNAARTAGWTLVGLGPTRLRVETAAIVGAGLVLSRGEGDAP
ncbi:MAG: methyltransferase, RsmE family [Planctomycetota bacterium]|nr:methyltransferase, RsmE family [Planctomycetota bacterium]